MRTTVHNGRGYGSRHNDRNFNIELADHIDPKRVRGNIYLNCYDDPALTFQEAELRFYSENFGAQLDATNANYVKHRHPERCKTMEQWMMQKQHSPEETILQIGNRDGTVPAHRLWECYQALAERMNTWSAEHGKPFTILSAALHVDEQGASHVHQRKAWHYVAEDGSLKTGQEKALEAAGVQLPKPGKSPGRLNNRKMTFDAMQREMWLEILKEHGLQIEVEPLPDGKHNRTKEQMIRDKYQDMIDETERLAEELGPLRDLKVAIDEVDHVVTSRTVLGMVVAKPQELEPLQDQAKAYRVNRDEIQDLRDKEGFLGDWHDRLDQREQQLDERALELDRQEQRNKNIHQIAEEAEKRAADLAAENGSLKAENDSLRGRVRRLEEDLKRQFRSFQSRLRAAHEAMTTVIKATGIFQRNRILDAVQRYAEERTRAEGFDDLANEMQQPGVSPEILQHVEPKKPATPERRPELEHEGPEL